MAKIIDTYISENGHEISVYESGAEYDTVEKRLVKGSAPPITVDNAREMQARSTARKREVMLAASNRAVQDKSLIRTYGMYAALAERATTLQTIATTADAGKAAVMAHQALTLDTGMAEPKRPDAEQTIRHEYSIDPATLAVLAEIRKTQLASRQDDSADAEIADENSAE